MPSWRILLTPAALSSFGKATSSSAASDGLLAMVYRLLLCATAMVLAACTVQPGAGPRPPGYLYYDANHPNAVTGASAQAIYNATHGTWLWAPGISGGAGGGGN